MLKQDQIAFYRAQGYLKLPNAIPAPLLAELRQVTGDLIDRSRGETVSGDVYDLDEGHGPESPRLTRIKLPHMLHPAFWKALAESPITEALRDLLGPNVLLNTSKLNTKAPGGGAAVEWHQDWHFYPHTNDDLLAVGLMLDDVIEENGPLQVIPRSHKGPILNHHNADGHFCGAVNPDDPAFNQELAVTLTGKAGDATFHHVRLLHGSAPNVSDRPRLICFFECLAGDAWPLVGSATPMDKDGPAAVYSRCLDRVVCGEPSMTPRMADVPVKLPLPPAPSHGSIFQTQKSAGARSAFG